jgi:putative transposase
MRYAQGGGLTPGEQEKRELLRLEVAERFARGDRVEDIARDLRVTARSVRRWRHAWRTGGADALRSRGPMAVERLSGAQWERLERELRRGPLAHGWKDESQGWTLKRIKLLIGRLFHVGYTVQGVWKLMHRHGWSAQVPVRRAMERDEGAIEVWKAQVWPLVKPPRATWAPTSASSCAVRRCVSCGGERPSPLTCRSREVELRAA